MQGQQNALPAYELHVVCVDDDQEFLRSLGLILPERLNAMREDNSWLRFSFFDQPAEALEFLQEVDEMGEEVALILSDQKMPTIKGTDFIGKAKRWAPKAACALLTGYAGIESAVDAINGKLLDRYLTKPIENEHSFLLSLHQLLEAYRRDRLIERQGDTLKDLYSFANTLNSIEEYKEALDYIVSFTAETLHCERVSLMLLEEGPEPYLRIVAAKGLPDDVVNSTRLSLGDRVAGSVMQNQKAVYVKSLDDLVPKSGDADGPASAQHASNGDADFMSVPMLWASLKASKTPVGVINATDKVEGQVFNEADLEILTYISNTATIAINNHLNGQRLKEAFIESKTQAAALTHMMHHNSVTGLPNRADLDARLERFLRGRAEVQTLTVVMINLNRFRDINCSIGHQGGDTILNMIAHRLTEVIDKASLFHIGSDEFAVLLENVDDDETCDLIAAIQAAMERSIEYEGNEISVHLTFGVASYPAHANNMKLLMQKADVALNQAKQSNTKLHIYNSERDLYNTRRLAMINELKHAIATDELVLHYQPKINLRSGRMAGVEALVRWIHPEHGFTPPDQFIGLAEQTGLIESLTDWVLRKAAKQCRQWTDHNGECACISVAVNLSTLNLLESGFAQKLSMICDEAGIATSRLHLEITESVIMSNIDLTMNTLNQLSEMGFRIDLDDFGTGYSSLAYVKNLPIDAIKIDRSFITDIKEDQHDVQIVQSIIELGHSLDLKVIAEGVEDGESEALLRRMGCDNVQGYYYSRPLPAADLEAWALARAEAPQT